MKRYDVKRPIGLNTVCGEIERTCSQAHLYKRCGLHPDHLVLPLDSGSGRTTLVEYMTDKYKEAGVLPFTSGPDDYLEITLDGSLSQLKQAFAVIDAAAVYANAYGNIVSMDISALAAHLGETQMTEFVKNIRKVCDSACVVFFVHSVPNRNEEKLLEKLEEGVDHIRRLPVEPYTREELCELMTRSVEKHGIEIRKEDAFREAQLELASEFGMDSVRDAVQAADSLVCFADYSGFIPTVDAKSVKMMMKEWHLEQKRRDVS